LSALLEVENLVLEFGNSAKLRALDGVFLSVERGSMLGIVGESGSGKSTLGRAFASGLGKSSPR
jgi:peptide/nickel transport system ATP-binding protein